MSPGSALRVRGMHAALVLLGYSLAACAARGHIATADEVARLKQASGLSASGRLTLTGPQGRFSTRVVFGVARPDSLRIEIPSGTGLRFLLVATRGKLRADLPQDDAMFAGPGTADVMKRLFGVDVEPKDLVGALLGSPPESLPVSWRFEGARPTQVTLQGSDGARLSLTFDDPEIEPPSDRAFSFGPPRSRSWTLSEMSDRLGLVR
ncbi:MAG: hypothetical protein JJE39_05615 [Vicinamibacteria bacterium]|nr:hypothetical protein [Vicinamibacteria bacterium]